MTLGPDCNSALSPNKAHPVARPLTGQIVAVVKNQWRLLILGHAPFKENWV